MLLTGSILLALVIDRYCGEPPLRLHPVVWIGNYLRWAGQRVQRIVRTGINPDYPAFWLAALYWCAGAAVVFLASWWLQELILTLPAWLAAVLMGLALKPLLAWAMLKSEVLAVTAALDQSLAAGRERLSWLVSRDTSDLSAA